MIRSLTAIAVVFLTTAAAYAEDTPAAGASAAESAPAKVSTPSDSPPAASTSAPNAQSTDTPATSPSSTNAPATASAAAAGSAAAKDGKTGPEALSPSTFKPNASTLPPPKPFVYKSKSSDIATGKEDAPVTIVEYASLSCPHCAHFFKDVLPELTTKYIDTGKARLVFRSYPLNDPALKAAELVQCAPPESRSAFVRVLFSSQMKWAYDSNYREALGNFAVFGGIDRLKFESCMNNKDIEKIVLGVAKEAQDDYHVNSTPTFFVNSKMELGMHDAASLGKMITEAIMESDK